MGMGRGYLNPSGTWMRFDFSSPLDMSRITDKNIEVGYGDGEGKTYPKPAQLSCLNSPRLHRESKMLDR